jgi:hypothetical protein
MLAELPWFGDLDILEHGILLGGLFIIVVTSQTILQIGTRLMGGVIMQVQGILPLSPLITMTIDTIQKLNQIIDMFHTVVWGVLLVLMIINFI